MTTTPLISTTPSVRVAHDRAGASISVKVPVVSYHATVGQVIRDISEDIRKFETINYIHVVDEKNVLVGIFSIRELYRHKHSVCVADFMTTHVLTVHPETEEEKVSFLALKHRLKSIPVVDNKGVFLGVIPNDKVLSILYKEMRKDILHITGVPDAAHEFESDIEMPVLRSVKLRIPWLLIGLVGGIFAAKVVGWFDGLLEEHLVLVAFIPLIVYLSAAVGTQMQAFIIRDFALYKELNFFKYFVRQTMIVSTLSLVLGAVLYALTFWMYRDLQISLVLAVALIATTLSALIAGVIIPYILRMMKSDPADSSGPIGTIFQDIVSIVIYFLVATAIL